MFDLSAYNNRVAVLEHMQSSANTALADAQLYKAKADKDLELGKKLQDYIREAAQMTLEPISAQISAIVTDTLKAVLPNPYEFVIEFKVSYGQLACAMYLTRDGMNYNMRKQNGDGAVDLVALALRIATICIDKRNFRRLLLLDEPCGAVSVDYQPYVGKLIEYLTDQLKLQVIMIAAHGSNMGFTKAKIFNTKDFKVGAVL